MGPRALAIAVFLTGCIDAELVPCGELACAVGQVCTPGGCASPGDVAACAELADGAECKTTTSVTGTCLGGSCQTGLCGNGRLDPGELCDLGGGNGQCSGCSADCRSDESCGNGIVDPECGETCDDANANPADGCESCKLTAWQATALISGRLDATMVALGLPQGIAVDRGGNVFIADAFTSQIRRVDPDGVITVVAGTGVPGDSGDGGSAVSAQIAFPHAVAVDGLGNVYIADSDNYEIRRVDPDGIITTIAGNGTYGYSGDGNVATAAQMTSPQSVAVDGLGTIYIADTDSGAIRAVDPSGIITTIAGNGTFGFSGDGGPAAAAQLDHPIGVATDAARNVYIADSFNQRIRRVDPAGRITTVAGNGTFGFSGDGGPATAAQLDAPIAVAVDGAGNLYIVDSNNYRIRRVDTAGIITTVAGSGGGGFGGDHGLATSALLSTVGGVAADTAGDLFIADTYNLRIRRVDLAGVITTIAGNGSGLSGDGGAATSADPGYPLGIAVALGNLYIADASGNVIRRIDAAGVITTIAGDQMYGYGGDGGAATGAQLAAPSGIAADGAGNIYIADTQNSRIRRIDPAGVITTIAGTSTSGYSGDGAAATGARLSGPSGVAVDASGNLYIADTGNHCIRRVDTGGTITTVAGTGTSGFSGDGAAAIHAQLAAPNAVAVDAHGNVWIADTGNNRIRQIDPAGMITTVAGSGVSGSGGDGGLATSAQLFPPYGVAVDGDGNLYIPDMGHDRLRRVDPGGTITTIAGGLPIDDDIDDGDGGPSSDAELASPYSVAVDGAGRVYVGDSATGEIRRIATNGVITTVAGLVDPAGMGPLPQARLTDPRALVVAAPFTLFAGGTSGTVQAATATTLEVVTGRYAQPDATAMLARFRDQLFGTVTGIAYDATTSQLYLTESTANRIHVVTIVDPADVTTWTIAPLANATGTAGFADGAASTARFREPTGLYLDPAARQLYVADTGNHVIRAIDLATATVRTVVGIPATRGYFGDGGAATAALLFAPQAITRCANGDLFVADTGNDRVRRIAAATGTISTVVGVGIAASAGDGRPASTFPVNAPLGLACDPVGNLFVTSTTTVRLVLADPTGIVDGSGAVATIYGDPLETTFPASVTSCLTGLTVVDGSTLEIVDSCTGLLVELHRRPR